VIDHLPVFSDSVASFLASEPRNALGALDHLGLRTVLGRLYPASIWIDSLMMYGLPATQLAMRKGDDSLLEFATRQPRIFADALQDEHSGLFRHAYWFRRRTRKRGSAHWLRGNGWAAAALADMLDVLPATHHSYAAIESIFDRLVAGLTEHQRPDGLWSTVIDDPRTYSETSGSCLVAYAIAKGCRLRLSSAAERCRAERTCETLCRRVDESGRLDGTSYPTIPSCAAGYALIPRGRDISYGVGAFCMLAAELNRG
jgi:unsaturated rhamnogalacturonyl hydrolase